jgi:large subunit ribosomal protein L17
MRHRKKKITLGRERGPRLALMRGLAESLILHGTITTTEAKAKALRGIVEPLVTTAKAGTLVAERRVRRTLYTDQAVRKLMREIAPKYKERPGGYTRVTKLGVRASDRGSVARIEFV